MKTLTIIAFVLLSLHLPPLQAQAIEPFSNQTPSKVTLEQSYSTAEKEHSNQTTMRSRPIDPEDPGTVPLGEGILILSALAIGYATYKRK